MDLNSEYLHYYFHEYLSPFTVTILTLCLVSILLLRWKNNYNIPPGPRGLPLFGYYPFLSNKPYLDFDRLAKRYGNVFSFRTVGGNRIVVLNGVKIIKEVLVHRSEEFIGRAKQSNLVSWVSDELGITQEDGEPWKEQRRFFLQTVKNYGFGKRESEVIILDEMKTLLKSITKSNGKPTDLKMPIYYLANSVICQILFSKKYDRHKDSFEDIANGGSYLVEMFTDNRAMIVGVLFKYVVMKLFPSTRRLNNAKKLYENLVQTIIEEHLKTLDPNHLRDYIDSYLYHVSKMDESINVKKHSFTMQRLKAISVNIMMDGTESVGGTVLGLLEELSHHVAHQKLAQEELDFVVGNERLPSLSDRPRLPYLEALIQELFRMTMPFKLSTLYSNFKETTIAGYRIPRRSIIVANLWTINFDPKLYPEPEKFNPKRFLDESGKKIKTEGPYPFGLGKRTCIGESLAQMEVFLIIASILQSFTLYANQNNLLKAVPRN